jgi:methyl-accepting chemotaxis protein
MQHDGPSWILILFTAVTAAAFLMQAVALLMMAVATRAAVSRLNEVTKQAQEHALPALATARHLLDEVSPKLKVAVQNVLEVSHTLKNESTHVSGAVDLLLKKAEVQVDRVDEMVTGTLDSIAYATSTVQRAVVTPVRQVGAVLSGLRAGFDVLRSKDRSVHAGADGDHFV